ncbi:MAG: hypothetical protein LBG29_07915, partial [Synergistaceae bacterium]|nr:hypothetical protein [Synergistaceae bacterium]
APSVISPKILKEFLLSTGNYRSVPFAGGQIGLVDARRCCHDVIAKLSQDPYFFLGQRGTIA